MLHNCSMQNDTSRSDEILTAFAETLFEQQDALDRLAYHRFDPMPGHPRTCWACGGPKRDHEMPADTRERGPVVELDLTDLTTAPQAVAGPPRAPRKHVP